MEIVFFITFRILKLAYYCMSQSGMLSRSMPVLQLFSAFCIYLTCTYLCSLLVTTRSYQISWIQHKLTCMVKNIQTRHSSTTQSILVRLKSCAVTVPWSRSCFPFPRFVSTWPIRQSIASLWRRSVMIRTARSPTFFTNMRSCMRKCCGRRNFEVWIAETVSFCVVVYILCLCFIFDNYLMSGKCNKSFRY